MRITCPFCYAMILGKEIPDYCPHCGTKFEVDDDLKKEKTWMEKGLPDKYAPIKEISTIFRS